MLLADVSCWDVRGSAHTAHTIPEIKGELCASCWVCWAAESTE